MAVKVCSASKWAAQGVSSARNFSDARTAWQFDPEHLPTRRASYATSRYTSGINSRGEFVVHSTFELWLIAGLALAAGIAAGYWAPRQFKGGIPSNARALEDELAALREKHQAYRHEVASHFDKSAELLAQLMHDYREIHNHLAHGGAALCENENIKLLKLLPDERMIEQQVSALAEPPRDYAPKQQTNGKSVLDEDFGIEKVRREPTPEPPRY